MDSRSSSPKTPDVGPDEPRHVTIHNEPPSWCLAFRPLQSRSIPATAPWDGEGNRAPLDKHDDERILELSDLIDEHAYDDSPPGSGVEHSPLFSHPPSDLNCSETTVPTDSLYPSSQASPQQSEYHLPSHSHLVCTPIVPPPAMRPRKRESNAVPHPVVCPPRESCYNLSILTPNIPKSGTKSRVETQIRVTIDLAFPNSPSGDPCQYDRVGSWKWLKLPPGTSTKRRTRREGKIDPSPMDILHLTTSVTCASSPYNQVLSCGSCRNREAKRVARKLAARVRPTRSDSDGAGNSNERLKGVKEDTTSIIQFNCPEILDFSSGSAVLPVRITCYCRHHREKVGFNVHFTMRDHSGRLVGTGISPPIMITDDHKSTMKSGSRVGAVDGEAPWFNAASNGTPSDLGTPSKRSVGKTKNINKRAKPYDAASRSNSTRFSREASIASLSSSANSPSVPRTRSPTPLPLSQSLSPGHNQGTPATEVSSITVDGESLASSFGIADDHISPPILDKSPIEVFPLTDGVPNGQATHSVDTVSSPIPPAPPPTHFFPPLVPPQPMSFLFFDPTSPQTLASLPVPKIHRLIPSSGPTYGGIEVTVLGENFHPAVQLNCVFGDTMASSTQRWSDNTLLCVLPPRASPGVVAVWFEGIEKTREVSPPPLFTYTDESDRTLMVLALQVVGLKMTGKVEDAKNVALRIVGSTEDVSSMNCSSNTMQAGSTAYDIRPLLLVHSEDRNKFENSIIDLLSVVDVAIPGQAEISMSSAMSHATLDGQTLLHLAAFLGFAALTEFLIAHAIDLDARDRNGYTALHFSALSRSQNCAALLVSAGADLEIVNALGKTPQDISPTGFFNDVIQCAQSSDSDSVASQSEDDGESNWADVETDEEPSLPIRRKQSALFIRQRSNRRNTEDVLHATETTAAPVEDAKMRDESAEDEKRAASFVNLIQRTFIPNIPQIPLLHLPEMPAVPWDVLPQIPMVFHVFVPMPGWPSFLSEKREGSEPADLFDKDEEDTARPVGYSAIRTAQELRATWEKWVTTTAALRQQPVEEPPPKYTPRESPEASSLELAPNTPPEANSEPDSRVGTTRPGGTERSSRRRSYEVAPVGTQDVNSFGYVPAKSRTKQAKQKHDRMLVLFWLPILLMSLLWAFHSGICFALQTLKTTLFVKASGRM
ncbi:hypothetical protein BKA82DRAFT_996145 [Pisolithus tinctorius]|uniref:IPT/TIG domain-containing protein n=1 Tax=Pisolithus tinctorius Marx 270 TaxID=870435 RepID=A0A0C3JM04_PISTI|nr:hypothetical protein BKA82DRAFT_996145 [Pisolithus tinctorius]KIO10198.1 hypothetical protein M404DRAFT_996145 [Pisolithus tinctorius Marx 270]